MIRNRLSRRQFLRTSAIAGGVLALAACTPAGSGTAPEASSGEAAAPVEEGGVVSYWVNWSNLEPAMNIITASEEFQEHMGGTTIDFRGSVNDEALLTAIAGGTPPDCHSNHDYPNLFARGAAIAVDDMVEASDIVTQDRIVQWIWDYSFFDGQMIGVPGIESYVQWGLNYNAVKAEEAGLDPDSPPVSWDELYAWHEALTLKDDAGNLMQLGLDPHDAMGGDVDFQTSSYGVDWYNEETKEFDLDNEAMVAVIDKTADFIRYAGPDQFSGMRQVEGNGAWGLAYEAGVQAMIIEGYWHPGETTIAVPDVGQHNRASWAPVSEDRRDVKMQAANAHFVQILREGKNPTGSFKLGEMFNTVMACDVIFKEVGWIHGVNDFIPTVDANAFPGLAFYIQSEQEATEWHLLRRCPIHWFVKDQWDALREEIARDQITAAEAAGALQQRAVDEFEAQGLSG